MRTQTVLLALFTGALAWEKYARPIKMAQPNANGVYEFTFDVAWKMGMQGHDHNGHGTPVEYDVDTKQWQRRNRDQMVDCFEMHNITDANEFENIMDDVIQYDGRHERIITINGESPGPVIAVPYGAEVSVKVRNHLLMDSITVHFHGIDKMNLWYMDGVAYMQQCPIQVKSEFEYRFMMDSYGTHWWHGHFMTDRGDGLCGGLVVYRDDRSVPMIPRKKNGPKRVVPEREYFMIMQDWAVQTIDFTWHSHLEKTMKWMFGTDDFKKCWQPTRLPDGSGTGGSAPISAILINSKGWKDQSDVVTRSMDLPLETYQIKRGEHVLYRIVNAGVAHEIMVHVEGHQMTVTAADGQEVVPRDIDYIIVFPGETYDVLIKGLNMPTQKRYSIIAETVYYYWWDWTKSKSFYGIAHLEYEEGNLPAGKNPDLSHPECSLAHRCTVLNCPFQQWPQMNIDFPFECIGYEKLETNLPIEDAELMQDTPFTQGFEEHFINMHYDSHMNEFKFESPNGMPYYHSQNLEEIGADCSKIECSTNSSRWDPKCKCFYHLNHKLDNIVQITMYNMGEGGGFGSGYAHPFHIHGHQFYVMKVGYPEYDSNGHIAHMNRDITCEMKGKCDNTPWANSSWMRGAIPGMNTVNPSLRDTVTIPTGGYIVLRFRAKNAGWWFAHCHLTIHAMGGTAYAFKVGEDDEIAPPPANFPHDCGRFSMDKIPEFQQKTKYAKKSSSSSILPTVAVIITAIALL